MIYVKKELTLPTNKNKPIDPNSPEFWKDFDPFEFDGPKDYVDGKSDAHVNRAHANRMKALNPEWVEKVRIANQLRSQDPEWQENIKVANQLKAQDPEWLEKVRIANQLKAQDPEWLENNKLGAEKRVADPKWQKNNKLGAEKRAADPKWQENHKVAMQKLAQDVSVQEKKKLANQKRCNKQVSCDGVIYESGKAAAIAIAPETFKTTESKAHWLKRQMKKYPERYFYITQSE